MNILITGATSNIGYLLAKELSKKNHTVYLSTHTKEQLNALEKKISDDQLKVKCFKMDITSKEDRRLIQKIEIDVLINHAGIGNGGSILEMDIKTLEKNR